MNSSQNSAFSYKNNRPLSWPVIHANIITHSHVHGVSFFVPFCSRICSTFVPKKQSYFANLDFGSNVRFPAPILDIHIITHSHVRCVTYFFPLLSLGFPKKFPKNQSNDLLLSRNHSHFLETSRNLWILPSITPDSSSRFCACRSRSRLRSTEKSGNSHWMIRANHTSAPTS